MNQLFLLHDIFNVATDRLGHTLAVCRIFGALHHVFQRLVAVAEIVEVENVDVEKS